jgi:hypothetical protein
VKQAPSLPTIIAQPKNKNADGEVELQPSARF